MKLIDVNIENIDKEHICCAISNKKDDIQVSSKKLWLKDRFEDGLVFKKGDVRGKVFIEYIPAENAWIPIDAKEYMFINCFWVSGKFKGQGIGRRLLEECINDSKDKGKKGLVVLSSDKKRPYLSDPKYLKKKGFIVADRAEPYFELLYLPFEENVYIPKFKDRVKSKDINELGFTLYYSNQCPFTAKYVALLSNYMKDKDINFRIVKYENKEHAQNSTTPFTTYSIYYNGKFITHEILNEKKLESLICKYNK